VLAVVALANLLAALLTGNRESARSAGVQAALGFTPRQIVTQGAVGAAFLGLAAVAVGVPIGLGVSTALGNLVTAGIGLGPGFGHGPGLGVTFGLVLVTPLLCALLGAVAARGLARYPVSELLRWE
jgi:putative ABC transport system permease protein